MAKRRTQTEPADSTGRVIPEGEAWLSDNPIARDAVRRGLQQARAGELSDGPDLDKAGQLLGD